MTFFWWLFKWLSIGVGGYGVLEFIALAAVWTLLCVASGYVGGWRDRGRQ